MRGLQARHRVRRPHSRSPPIAGSEWQGWLAGDSSDHCASFTPIAWVKVSFIGFRWTPGERDEARAARALAERLSDGAASPPRLAGLVLLHRGAGPIEVLPHGMGFVFGERFGRRPVRRHHARRARIQRQHGITERWGAYVAVLIDRGFDVVRVLRDPSGARPVSFLR